MAKPFFKNQYHAMNMGRFTTISGLQARKVAAQAGGLGKTAPRTIPGL